MAAVIDDAKWSKHWLDDLSTTTGASVESSDVERLAHFRGDIREGTSTHAQMIEHMLALTEQYTQRGKG